MLLKKKKIGVENPLKEKAAKGIVKFLLKVQTRFSDFMNKQTKNISPKGLKLFLIVFCVFGGGFSTYFIIDATLKTDKEQQGLKIEKVNFPKYYDNNNDAELQSDQYVDQETYQRILSFDNYMDSLMQTESGRRIHDSILLARPGLPDSIAMLKEIYQSQIK
jgi:hypothetical protein